MAQITIRNLKDRIDAIDEVGTLPQVMARILSVVEDDSSTALDLASEIANDQALTSRILRAVNSAYYGFHRQILTVPEAVVILGFNEVERLSLAIAVINTMQMDRDNVQALRNMWRHSLACSVAGTVFEQRYANEMPAVRGAHVAGLIHDIGKAVIHQYMPEKATAIHRLVDNEGMPIEQAERELLEGYTHSDVGGWMAERWGLPEPLVDCIRYHHQPETAGDEAPLVHATHLIDHIANSLGFSSLGGPYITELNPLTAAMFTSDAALSGAVQEQLDRSHRMLGAVGSGAMF